MKRSELNFELPPELIASKALAERSASRMLKVARGTKSFADGSFSEFPELLRNGDVLVLNDTKVFPARLFGRTENGGNVELFLIEDLDENRWRVLARPAKRLKPGRIIGFDDELKAQVLEKLEDGKVLVRFETAGDLDAAIDRIGKTPLPPYIKRLREEPDLDRERYQTVFARTRGAIAAPTAGLHFTPEILDKIKANGVEILTVTLHVGYGTFEPVRAEDLSEHRVLPERFSMSAETAERLNAAQNDGRRIVAVGTTTTRTLEYSTGKHGEFREETGYADLTITPGYKFKAVGALLTNFHLPESSLLLLVSVFAGRELIMKAYEHAVGERYRFYSYGDCMFIE
jgi:S-adenosylmethionine:tRNA ribosyltransferase-isomerase